MRINRLIIAAGAALVISLVLNLPAGVAVGWAGLDQRIAMEGVHGTVWSGGASAASVDGIYLGQLRWRFQPAALLAGRLSYHLAIAGPAMNVDGSVGPAGNGGVRLADAHGVMRMNVLSPLVPAMGTIGLDGTLDLDVARVVLVPTDAAAGAPATVPRLWPSDAQGTIRVKGVRISLLGAAPIGDYEVAIQSDPQAGDLLLDYRDLAGPLELAGNARVRPDGTFERQCTAKARPGAPPPVVQAAPFLCESALF
jgi:general secretion pathway protein N